MDFTMSYREEFELRQFKLTSGEEIVAEILQWNEESLGGHLEIVCRKAMRLKLVESTEGVKYYSFRPWMVYQEHPDDILILNGNNVVGIAFPPDTLVLQYDTAVKEMTKMAEDREKEFTEQIANKVHDGGGRFAQRKPRADNENDYGLQEFLTMDSGSNVVSLFGDIDPNKIH
jgi:hypothetical protein|tara:strand:- start:413 stop:931 length:519 start_codon:yes stop_codon:yes gene_type:complete